MKRSSVMFHTRSAEFATRQEPEGKYIEGYFVLFNTPTELWPGFYEQIAPSVGEGITEESDIRALINHDTSLVLGRTKAKTLEIRVDEKGIYGRIKINEKDTDAMNLYARVARGDVSQCSFGFCIIGEKFEDRQDGTYLSTITQAEIFEISVCTFPAYPDTNVSARSAYEDGRVQQLINYKKQKAKERLKHVKGTYAFEKT